MKKVAVMALCAALCLQLTACGGSGETGSKGNSTSKDSSGAAAFISDKLESGEFVIDGEKYTFPSGVSEWTSNGWHISHSYGNIDTFELEYNVESTEFEVFNDEKDSEYVSMCAINLGFDPVKIEEATTAYLEMKVLKGKKSLNVELPGGITCESTRDDVINAYGEPQEEEDDILYYMYTNKDDIDVTVGISITFDTVDRVTYTLSDSNWGYVTNAEECVEFVDEALKTSFYGEFDTYVEKKFDTEEGAQELYASEVEYYAESVMYYLYIDYETVDPAIAEGFYDLAAEILTKLKWDTPVVDLADGASRGTVEITMYPIDFLDIILDDAQAVVDSGVEEDDEYAQAMLDAISVRVSEISYTDPVTKTYDVDLDYGVISQDDWDEMDDILMGFWE